MCQHFNNNNTHNTNTTTNSNNNDSFKRVIPSADKKQEAEIILWVLAFFNTRNFCLHKSFEHDSWLLHFYFLFLTFYYNIEKYLCMLMTANFFCTSYAIQYQTTDNQMAELLNSFCHISLNNSSINLRLPGEAWNSPLFQISNFSWFWRSYFLRVSNFATNLSSCLKFVN